MYYVSVDCVCQIIISSKHRPLLAELYLASTLNRKDLVSKMNLNQTVKFLSSDNRPHNHHQQEKHSVSELSSFSAVTDNSCYFSRC